MPRIILHVDMDAFYPSVEQRENPSLKGLPVIVGADPKEGKGRGVVTSCSYEARKFGVRSGQPISEAYRLCPQAVYLRPNFDLYGQVSDRVMGLLRLYADKFEQISIDEAFLDVAEKAKHYGGAMRLVEHMKNELCRAEGLTCSIGIAPNKSSAKIASDMQKPNGLTIVESERVKEFLSPLPVAKIPGVGKKAQEILSKHGISTIGELASLPPSRLTELFGKNGIWLWAIANGLEDSELEERTEVKSMSVNHTFEEDVPDKKAVLQSFEPLVDELYERIGSENCLFKTVGITVRFKGFETFAREKSLPNYVRSREVIARTVRALFGEFMNDKRKIRMIGAKVSRLRKIEADQRSLLGWAANDLG